MRININGVELVVPDDCPVRIDSGVVSVGSSVAHKAPLQITHVEVDRGSGTGGVHTESGSKPQRGRPRKILHTTEAVKDAIISLIRKQKRPLGVRSFSMKLNFMKGEPQWKRSNFINVVLEEMLQAGVLVMHRDGQTRFFGLPGMEFHRQPSGRPDIPPRQLPVAGDDQAA